MTMTTDDMRPADTDETADFHNGYRAFPGAVESEHGVVIPVTGPTVMVIETYFLEDDVHDGSFPLDDTVLTAHPVDDDDDSPVDRAVRLITNHGLSFAATGTDWAANPDGSKILDYAAGKRVETTAHLYGFTPDQIATIVEQVG